MQVRPTDDEGISPPNLLVIHEAPERGYGTERHFIPYVPQIVQQINDNEKELLVKAPKGLLNLGREKAALDYVEPLLRVSLLPSMLPGAWQSGPAMPAWGALLIRALKGLLDTSNSSKLCRESRSRWTKCCV